MTTSPEVELATAVIVALRADATLIAQVAAAKILAYVPEGTDEPYIEIVENSTGEWDTDTDNGKVHTVSISAWSSQEGPKEVQNILRAVYDVLQDNVSLSLTGHNLVNMRYLFQDVVREPDGQLYHGIVQFRAVTEEI